MKSGRVVSIVIPVYNEKDRIRKTLEHLKFPWIKEIILINDGSTDGTEKEVENFPGIKMINFNENRGKGQAVQTGISHSKGQIIAILDADLGSSVREIDKLVAPVLDGEIEIAIASIPIRGGGVGLVRKIANFGLKTLTGRSMKAPLSGQRVFQRKVLNKIIPFQDGFGLEIAMDINIIRNNLKFKEIECDIMHRITGNNWQGYLHRGKQFIDIFKTIIKYMSKSKKIL